MSDHAELRLKTIEGQAHDPVRRSGILSVVASVCWFLQALVVSIVMAAAATGDIRLSTVAVLIAVFAALGVTRAILNDRAAALAFDGVDAVLAYERKAFLARLVALSPKVKRDVSSADLAALAGEKLGKIQSYLARYRPAALRVRILPVIILLVIAPMSWAAVLILLMTGPLVPVFMALVGYAAKSASEKQMAEVGNLNTFLLERIKALPDILLLDGSAELIAGISRKAENLRRRTMAVLAVAFLSSAVLELFSAIGVALMAVYVGFSLLGILEFGTWGAPLSVWQGIFILLLTPEFFQPLRDLAAAWHDRADALAVAGELADRDDQHAARIVGTDASAAHPDLIRFGRLETRSATLGAQSGRKALQFADLTIKAGERVALMGPSGVGKSSLLALLAGLIEPDHGVVLINGTALTEENARPWRAVCGWIDQQPHFLNASLKSNLVMGRQSVSDQAIKDAIDRASARHVVDRLPRGLQTRIGESGAGVSGGEARRLMLARLFCQDPAVVLADEPTADLDAENADVIMAGLLDFAKGGKTLIVATHDERLAARLDRRIVLEG